MMIQVLGIPRSSITRAPATTGFAGTVPEGFPARTPIAGVCVPVCPALAVFLVRLLRRVSDIANLLADRTHLAAGLDQLVEVHFLERLRQLHRLEPLDRPLRRASALQSDATGDPGQRCSTREKRGLRLRRELRDLLGSGLNRAVGGLGPRPGS